MSSECGEDFREVLCWQMLLNLPQFSWASLSGGDLQVED